MRRALACVVMRFGRVAHACVAAVTMSSKQLHSRAAARPVSDTLPRGCCAAPRSWPVERTRRWRRGSARALRAVERARAGGSREVLSRSTTRERAALLSSEAAAELRRQLRAARLRTRRLHTSYSGLVAVRALCVPVAGASARSQSGSVTSLAASPSTSPIRVTKLDQRSSFSAAVLKRAEQVDTASEWRAAGALLCRSVAGDGPGFPRK